MDLKSAGNEIMQWKRKLRATFGLERMPDVARPRVPRLAESTNSADAAAEAPRPLAESAVMAVDPSRIPLPKTPDVNRGREASRTSGGTPYFGDTDMQSPPRGATRFNESRDLGGAAESDDEYDAWEAKAKQMCTYDPADRMYIADVVGCLARLVANTSLEVPGWRLEPDLVKCPEDDGALMSQASFASHYLGQWKDAVVAVVKPEEGFFAMGRSVHSVADLWYSLKHPAIQQLYGVDDEKGMIFVCENAERGKLSSHLGSNLKDIDLWKVLLDMALALHYMHCRGIVHGDIGFHNIFVTADGRGKLSGFFLSSQQDGAYTRQCSPEDEPTTEEEWKPLACSQGHHAGYSSDVYWLGRCIIDVIGGELVRSKEIPSTSSKCARCSMRQLPSQPESFSVEEWRLVSDMCHGDIKMHEVVDRLARLAAVNAVVSSQLKNILRPLPSNARQKVQGMMLAVVASWLQQLLLPRLKPATCSCSFKEDILQGDKSNQLGGQGLYARAEDGVGRSGQCPTIRHTLQLQNFIFNFNLPARVLQD
ncbi:hypothetical protein PF010_g29804 [Phytophthora fragariae]|uniref:Protein kinase domain-containing protein n=1 Tax=Phytophthora fragariae TaxID=53985 RepID=A0A6G0JN28_9STRA|nr:hypothetical protein PF010_g29804 [Phytophthora fragariae]